MRKTSGPVPQLTRTGQDPQSFPCLENAGFQLAPQSPAGMSEKGQGI